MPSKSTLKHCSKEGSNVKPEEDAVGQAMLAFYEKRKSFEVIEREDGYFEVTNTRMYFEDFEHWAEHEKKAMNWVRGRVLDIGCGAGRHSLHLQSKGLNVVAIDRSPLAIKVSQLRGVKKAKVMALEDIEFKPNAFETVLMLGGNFALLGNPKKALRVLRKLHRMTSDDAVIIAEAVDPYVTDNPAQLKYYALNKRRGKLPGQWRIRIRFHNFVTKWFDLLHNSKKEMEEILSDTGWTIKWFIDSGNPYIAIIEKVKKK
ncbi:MAG TPA: class I SAM-dependent methyltransferase [Candidatus Bathyarchaeia archaeon]|nr:class I SAM-dependent methyltransferase [Candidatus Bathyarchaeia archaeon]